MQSLDLPLRSSPVREDTSSPVFAAHGHAEIPLTGTLKSIIKRDGRMEPYTPKKLNGWGRWAADAVGNKVDWSSIVINAVSSMPAVVSSGQLQEKLIQNCLDKETWSYYLMAGRLYASHLHKMIHDLYDPSIKQLHERMANDGIMLRLDYDAAEYAKIETFINHERDYDTPYFSLHYIRRKYSLQNRTTGQEYETQQFVYMRMAMALAENEPKAQRLDLVHRYYNEFADKLMSAPTPNYVNLGTRLRGFASCCLYVTDDNEQSLAIGDHIAYRMTAASAGIGSHYITRSKGDPVRGGLIEHQGKLPYFASLGKAVNANMQAGRGGACTTYYSGFDPEAEVISYLRNPRSTEDRKNRDLHYALVTNRLFAEKVAKNEDAFSFNVFTAPKLAKLFFSSDADGFKQEYERLEQDPSFKKNYFNPRDLILTSLNEALETGVAYLANIDEMNRHTPFIEPIHSSNLCLEICEPNRPYQDMRDLYSDKEVGYITVATTDGAQQRFNFNEPLALDNGRVIFAGHLKVGDVLEVMPPTGGFTLPHSTENTNNYVFYAAGSGITPCLSMIRSVLAHQAEAAVSLYYGNKHSDSIIFREVLEGLKNQYMGRFSLHHILSQEAQDSPLFCGRINAEKCVLFEEKLNRYPGQSQYFLCGPAEMVFEVKDCLTQMGVDSKHLHFELFTTAGMTTARAQQEEKVNAEAKIRMKLDGLEFEFDYTGKETNILDAALKNGADLPFACKGGVCSTCKAHCDEGEVSMAVNYALEPDEVEAGYVLTCQSRPKSKFVYINFDK